MGSGFMGVGIAQVAAQAGDDVILNDTTREWVARGLQTVSDNLDHQVKKRKISESDKRVLIAKIAVTADLNDAAVTDFVIEAAFESFDVKRDIFEKLGCCLSSRCDLCDEHILKSHNKTGVHRASAGKVYRHAFFQPVPVMALVGIIR